MPSNGWDSAGISLPQEGGNTLPAAELDRLFRALADRQCRLVLLLLVQTQIERKTDLLERDGIDELSLIHHCLPKLDEAGYLEWDRSTGRISTGPRFEEVEPILALLASHTEELPPESA